MTNHNATYFGKTPLHADFVYGRGSQKLIGLLDNWVARSMEQLCQTPNWKSTYNGTGAIDFAFVSPTSTLTLIGSLRASQDRSGRHFPFLTASTIQRNDVRLFRYGPSVLANSYSILSKLADSTLAGMELDRLQDKLDQLDCARDFDLTIANDPLGHFARDTTLEALSAALGGQNTTEAIARTILAIGLLMQQLFTRGHPPIEKELEIPLPNNAKNEYWQIAGLWLYLITAFIRNPSIELQIVLERNPARSRMLIGFNGATAHPLCTALMGYAPRERTLCLIDPPWIDRHHSYQYGNRVLKLSSYLAQPPLSLELIVKKFREAFF
ncbi:MAG: type VI secretion system-associated protein TagF [Proteobacteria bacterium]|nr:type VI secretion system-associated protein TagF [Pseudomonadota bacterium]